ncbi:MAG: AAA family ATPase, partial [Bacteroidia bacterium]|nr:AAA family ATPase [Bacteroidia bacterium]
MLKLLTIENYALIDHAQIEWGPGLNLITGETGAGKSIVVEALGLALGRRADASVLREADKKCIVEALFHVGADDFKDFEEDEVEILDNELILRREIAPSGKSRAFVNDAPVNLQTLRKIADRLAEMHGQNEGVQLLRPEVQLELLDRYAGLSQELSAYRSRFDDHCRTAAQFAQLNRENEQLRREAELLRFQYEEVQKAGLKPGEDERLEREWTRLSRAEEIGAALAGHIAALENDERSVANVLAAAVKALEKFSSLCPELAAEAQKLSEARVLVRDAVGELERVAESLETDPRELDRLQRRLNL